MLHEIETKLNNEEQQEGNNENQEHEEEEEPGVVLNNDDTNNDVTEDLLSSSTSTLVDAINTPLSEKIETLSPMIYENDFDLYNLLKEMLNKKNYEKQVLPSKTKLTYTKLVRNSIKALTARRLDSHFTNGKTEWSLIENGIDLYRSKVKCIGTDVSDFAFGDPVYLDLQPLSTRIKLMCKLIIIIQGACLERGGPPKLVQDRCIQFDGTFEDSDNNNLQASAKSNLVIKSNSCEDLLKENLESNINKNSNTLKDEESQKPKMSVFANSSSTSSSITNQIIPIHIRLVRKNSSRKHKTNPYSQQFIKNESFSNTSGTFSDDEMFHQTSDYVYQSRESLTSVSAASCDLEHYFQYRNSKYSYKDYASAPYYQYSGSKDYSHFNDKETNTVESYLDKNKNKSSQFDSKNSDDKSTSTDDLFNNYQLGFYSKYQLFSSKAFLGKQTTLTNSGTNLSELELEIPIRIPDTFNHTAINSEKDSKEVNKFNLRQLRAHELVKNSLNSLKTSNPRQRLNSSSSTFLMSDEDEALSRRLKMGPKKSSEWNLFKYNNTKNNEEKPSSKIFKKTTTTTTKTTTTTTTTKIIEESSDLESLNETLVEDDKFDKKTEIVSSNNASLNASFYTQPEESSDLDRLEKISNNTK